MSEATKRKALADIEAMESAAFRTGLLARRLLAQHPDLAVTQIRPGFVAGGKAELHISVDSCDDVRTWAERLGLHTESEIRSYTLSAGYENVYESREAKGEVDGATIEFLGTRTVEGAEREAWIAERDQAAVAQESGGAQ